MRFQTERQRKAEIWRRRIIDALLFGLFTAACLTAIKVGAAHSTEITQPPAQTRCAALVAYHEGRSEPLQVREAMVRTALNRGDDICRTIQRSDWLGRGQRILARRAIREPGAWNDALTLAAAIRVDPAFTATHFHHIKVQPRWTDPCAGVLIGRYWFGRGRNHDAGYRT